ncbi:protein translocase subunit SecF [Oscillospiraceae bacterium LTW-04]|nr:protein translocase subunit SecF [Oscillospiraceae bacterium MB24-C1]
MKKWNINFFKHRKIYFAFSITMIALMLVGSVMFGVDLDIQFKGGALITYSYTGDLDQTEFQQSVESVLGQKVSLQKSTDIATGTQRFVVSLPTSEGLNADKQAELATALDEKYKDNNLATASISVVNPTIGKEFLVKSLTAVAFASLLMVVYISLRFKKIGGWAAGITAVIALIHDLLMVFAVFVLFRISINANFIAICLTILGYSLNDTIVIYDRVRENKRVYGDSMPIEQLMNLSLNQSFTRSLMTSITTASAMTIVSIIAMMYNVTSILSFSFPMIIGMISGCYSSLCIATMLWVMWQKKKEA